MPSVIVTWCNNDPGSDLSSADLTLSSPHWGLRDLGASTCLASQQRVSGRVAACSRTSVSLFVDCFPHRILQASYSFSLSVGSFGPCCSEYSAGLTGGCTELSARPGVPA